jgi:hypothetical protein
VKNVNERERFFQFLFEYEDFFSKIVDAQYEKLTALRSRSIGELERSIIQQQAISMQLEYFEIKRLELQNRAGYSGLSLSQIADATPGEQRRRLRQSLSRMRLASSKIQFMNRKSMELAKLCLTANDYPAAAEEQPKAQGYTGDKKRIPYHDGNASLFEAKI